MSSSTAALYLGEALRDGNGSIHLIQGPMFAGKSNELADILEWAAQAKQASCLVRHGIDERGEGAGVILQTHEGVTAGRRTVAAGPVSLVRATALADVRLPPECKIVAVDEGQFFPDLAPECWRLANEGRVVFVAALNGDFAQKPWAGVSELTPFVTSSVMLHAWCTTCNVRQASFTALAPAADKGVVRRGQVEVGGADKYRAVCRACLSSR